MISLTLQAGILAVIGLGGCAVPVVIGRNQKRPRWLLPLATGTMVGLCAFGLLPEVVEEGGRVAVAITAGVALIYCFLHMSHIFQHSHDEHEHSHGHGGTAKAAPTDLHLPECRSDCGIDHQSATHAQKPIKMLFASIFIHSLFDGGLLVISNSLLASAAATVVFSLAIHKAFEALSLASIVITRSKDVKNAVRWLSAYVLSFPFGVMLAQGVKSLLPESVMTEFAIVIMAVAIGNLISCLIFDFVMPTLSQVQHRRQEVAWLLTGVAAAAILLIAK